MYLVQLVFLETLSYFNVTAYLIGAEWLHWKHNQDSHAVIN